MLILTANAWYTKLIRQFFFLLDKIVYDFIPTIYDLLIKIARTSISYGDGSLGQTRFWRQSHYGLQLDTCLKQVITNTNHYLPLSQRWL